MKLITETIEDIDILMEANAKGGKDYKIRGVFMQADIKNRNGRIYPVGTLQTEVARYLGIQTDLQSILREFLI